MSKIFEALLRLERESGTFPMGIPPEIRRVLECDKETPPTPSEVPGGLIGSIGPPEPPFDLRRVPEESVAITPAMRIVYHSQPDSAGADRFRLLRIRLAPLGESGKLKVLLITSPHPQDGKSTVVLNLATALSDRGNRKVLVVEGDLCHPSLVSRLNLPVNPGLSECLEGGLTPLPLVKRLNPLAWYLLSAGHAEDTSTELLGKAGLVTIFDKLRAHFDWILIDTPPILPLTDTLSLIPHADACLLVVRANQTPSDAVKKALGRIGSGKFLGIVLNGSQELEKVYAEYGGSYGQGRKMPKGAADE